MRISGMYMVYNKEYDRLYEQMEQGGGIMDMEHRRSIDEFRASVQRFRGENPTTELSDRQIARKIAKDEIYWVQESQVENKLKGLQEAYDYLGISEYKRVKIDGDDLRFGTAIGRYANAELESMLSRINQMLIEDGVGDGKVRQRFISMTIFGSE